MLSVFPCLSVYECTCMHVHAHAHAHTHTHTHTLTHAHAHTHTRMHTHTRAHARTHTHTNTHTQECPTSGVLLSESINMAPRPAQKSKSTDALKKNAADPYILVTIADLFWCNRKVDNARSWFKRCV